MVGTPDAGAVAGGLLDLAGAQLVALLRCPRPRAVLLRPLVIGGWGSNLLDRLGLHLVTAPGSRGRALAGGSVRCMVAGIHLPPRTRPHDGARDLDGRVGAATAMHLAT